MKTGATVNCPPSISTSHVTLDGMNFDALPRQTISRPLRHDLRRPALSPASRSLGQSRSTPRREIAGPNGPHRTLPYRISHSRATQFLTDEKSASVLMRAGPEGEWGEDVIGWHSTK